METLKDKIRILLTKNILLQVSTKEFILAQIDISEKRQLLDFVELLEQGLRATQKVFAEKAKSDPNFVPKVRRFQSTVRPEQLFDTNNRGVRTKKRLFWELRRRWGNYNNV
ncbi:hypothetical protein HC823_00615 [Candidatus Gracilibacteria bacterium]|nr:hypothetical protein [Candidatus Gracilibacteria bacterium]